MSVFMELMQAVEMGLRCKVDFETKSLHIDRKPVIENGVLLGERRALLEHDDLDEFEGFPLNPLDCPWSAIEYLYNKYKYSMPTKNSKVNKPYFKAEDTSKITAQHMACRPHRDKAQMMLEGFALFASMMGLFGWANPDHWFWQSEDDKDLVVLKKWVSC